MNFIYDDGGRLAAGYKGRADDCVVRAVAIASGRPYLDVYAAIGDGLSSQRKSKARKRAEEKAFEDWRAGRRGYPVPRTNSPRDGVDTRRQWFKDYMRSIGFEWTPTMHVGSGCTVHLADGELPMGRLVVSVSKHYTAVIDGVIHDTHDPSARGTTIYSPGYPKDQIPKGARWLDNGNGWAYSPQRCVYGYWMRKGAI